jgi:hypothetical protein
MSVDAARVSIEVMIYERAHGGHEDAKRSESARDCVGAIRYCS